MYFNFSPKGLILDFDGVFTDNKVSTDSNGNESIKSSKHDSLAISRFKNHFPNFLIVVISSEKNKSIFHRCNKLKINLIQGVQNKLKAGKDWAKKNNINLSDCMFLCNDTNDIELCKHVGFPIGVSDSNPLLDNQVLFKTKACGGNGAISEVLDLISNLIQKNDFSSLAPEFPLNESIGKRDWGEEILLFVCSGKYSVKKLFIKKGKKGGLQKHQLKDECAYVVYGSLLIRYDEGDGFLKEKILKKDDSIRFRPGCVHQEEALEDTFLLECSTPHFNDRIRMEGKYDNQSSELEGLPSTYLTDIEIK